jgi:hypothetical protein
MYGISTSSKNPKLKRNLSQLSPQYFKINCETIQSADISQVFLFRGRTGIVHSVTDYRLGEPSLISKRDNNISLRFHINTASVTDADFGWIGS